MRSQFRFVDETHAERDLFQAGDLQALPMFDRRDVISRFEQAGLRAGVEPRHPAAQQLYVQLVLLEINRIEIGDLQFAAR